MVHNEQITVYRIVAVDDGYGGATDEFLSLDDDAPTWATITEVSGNQAAFMGGNRTDTTLRIECNYKDGYQWATDAIIWSDLYGYVKVDSIIESSRLRGIRMTGNRVKGEQWEILSA